MYPMVENNKPIKKYKGKNVSLSVWENKTQDDVVLHSFSFQKSYKDQEDEWKQTTVLSVNDLPVLKTLLDEAYKDFLLKI